MNSGSTDKSFQPFDREIKLPEDFSESVLDSWMSRLPLSDVDSAGEAILDLLRAVNMTDGLKCGERIRIAEQIRPPAVSFVAMNSEKHLPASTLFPLSPENRRFSHRSVEICLELANAYRRIVTSGAFFSDRIMNETARAQIVYRALQAYGLALLHSLESYEPPPEDYWREVYDFYLFAEGHRMQTLSLLSPEIEGATVDSQFKLILLLALASTQHHRPDEIRQFYSVLMLIAKDAEIKKTPSIKEETALYCFDLGSDNSPRSIKRAKSETAGERRFLFTAAMLENAREFFSNPAQRAPERFKLRPELLTRLLETLGGGEKRRFARMSAQGTRRFVVGLPRLLDELSGEPPPLPETGPIGRDPTKPSQDEIEEEEIVLDHHRVTIRTKIWQKGEVSGSSAGSPIVELTGKLLNTSAGGYCMAWMDSQFPGARVGELIGLYEEGERIHIGVIRWLHHIAKFELVFGVELLSPEVEAVEVESLAAEGPMPKALYFSANERLGHPASLLSEPDLFKVGQTVVLRTAGGRLAYRLEGLLESTLSFQLFSLIPLEDSPTLPA